MAFETDGGALDIAGNWRREHWKRRRVLRNWKWVDHEYVHFR